MMGKPGSGKGTQAAMLAETLPAEIFSSGDRYRKIAQEDTFIGKKIKGIIDAGNLTPSWFAAFLFTESILAVPSLETKIIYEGSARKLEEAQKIHDVLTWLERPYAVFYLDVSEEEIMSRLVRRAELQGRKDDAHHSIPVRLEAYKQDTVPAIEFFRSHGKIIDINGNQPSDRVFAEIMEKIAKLP